MVCSAQGTDLFPVTFQCQARASLRNLIVSMSFIFLFSWITTNQELQNLHVQIVSHYIHYSKSSPFPYSYDKKKELYVFVQRKKSIFNHPTLVSVWF